MNFLRRIFGRTEPPVLPKKSAAQAFIDGDINVLTSKDIDPEGHACYQRYEEAMQAKNRGDFDAAERLLEQSCITPSIYSGHYRELFIIYRKRNRDDLEAKRYESVVSRVQKMLKYDDELIAAMLAYWSERQGKRLPPHHFDGSRNFKVSDARALLRAGEALGNRTIIQEGRRNVQKFKKEEA